MPKEQSYAFSFLHRTKVSSPRRVPIGPSNRPKRLPMFMHPGRLESVHLIGNQNSFTPRLERGWRCGWPSAWDGQLKTSGRPEMGRILRQDPLLLTTGVSLGDGCPSEAPSKVL